MSAAGGQFSDKRNPRSRSRYPGWWVNPALCVALLVTIAVVAVLS